MKITSYEEQKHNKEKLNVYVDGEYKFSISLNGWAENYLWVGKEITDKDIEQILLSDGKELAMSKLLSILSYGLKTEQELINKLKEKGFVSSDIQYAIEKGKEYGYVDDTYYADCYIRERAIPNGWGRYKTLNMLLQKGISKDIVNQKIDLYMNDEHCIDEAYRLAEKKLKQIDANKYQEWQIKQKIVSFLGSKGFEYDIIKTVNNKLFGDDYNI